MANLVSILVVISMIGLSLNGIIESNTTSNNGNVNTPSIQRLSQQLNTTLAGMFPNMNTMVWTNPMFNMGANKNLQQDLETKLNGHSPFSLILFNDLRTRQVAYDTYLSAMSAVGRPLLTHLVYSVNGNKSDLAPDKFLFTIPTIVITNSPNGMYFINETASNNNGIIWAMNSYQKNLNNPLMNSPILNGNVAQPFTLTNNGFSFLNTYGWYYNKVSSSSNQEVLSLSYKIDLYGVTSSTSSGTYYFVMAYTSSSSKGYSVSEPWYDYWILHDVPYYYENFKPSTFETTVNWQTTTWPGQELFSWGPQNSGSNAVVTYSVGASLSGSGPSVSAGVSYGVPGGITYFWNDQSSPAKGIAQTENRIGSSASSGTLYTVHPTSVGELNPTKSGGYPPFLFYAHFSVNTQSSGIPIWPQQYTISSPDISMCAY